jgi:thiamine biosynthesis protein ThiC
MSSETEGFTEPDGDITAALGAALAATPETGTGVRHAVSKTRAEHLAWCKQRAIEYADQGDVASAIASLASDLSKDPRTASSADIVQGLMMPLLLAGEFERPGRLREFIEGFN